ncbi:DNA-binding transcriptional regulator, MarR family [Sporobacter termitidis DSM 10068]|uniref:DNA-binding transcriptional regulator, MarR family n=1 Tax=Sporobacter termitidis DSM 10068 TaxID=1123282 RepID=A0A1M5VHI6_9FIRM|nr:MarR family winged helix-turn-helix transcriptional regulator [Sporobacter termitidis]SHH74544.1 DNA-binding transcriptional regulator, MarR family [Sporobacter termitidis DSM 10068]
MKTLLEMALYRAFHAQKNKIRPGMLALGLSPGQPKVLGYLSRRANCMQKDIAAALDIEPATVSQLLSNMEQACLVKRSEPAERRRAESVSVTETGREYYEKWLKLCREVEEISLGGFSQTEKEQFLDYLGRMYQNLTGKTLE